MPPSVAWGLGLGLLIAIFDTVAVVWIGSSATPTSFPIADLDQIANVVLYSLIGYQVGKRTGIVRDAAEGGVLAGVLVATIGVLVPLAVPTLNGGVTSAAQVVGVFATNIAIGGVLAIITGWVGSHAREDVTTTRR